MKARTLALCLLASVPAQGWAASVADLVNICNGAYGGTFGNPNSEPLGACQWDKDLINASDSGSYPLATGR